ncbi:hypothetical protein ACN0PV_004348, partial [Shigella dysenteriae]
VFSAIPTVTVTDMFIDRKRRYLPRSGQVENMNAEGLFVHGGDLWRLNTPISLPSAITREDPYNNNKIDVLIINSYDKNYKQLLQVTFVIIVLTLILVRICKYNACSVMILIYTM